MKLYSCFALIAPCLSASTKLLRREESERPHFSLRSERFEELGPQHAQLKENGVHILRKPFEGLFEKLRNRNKVGRRRTVNKKSCSPGPLSRIMLLVHCRRRESGLCQSRFNTTLHGYSKHFGKVMLLDQQNCPERKELLGYDELSCVAKMIRQWGDQFDGVMYAHFDNLLLPCRLAKHLNASNLAGHDVVVKPSSVREMISTRTRPRWMDASKRIRNRVRLRNRKELNFSRLPKRILQNSVNDAFYIPKAAYGAYVLLASEFRRERLDHESAGTTILFWLSSSLDIPLDGIGCNPGVDRNAPNTWFASPDFDRWITDKRQVPFANCVFHVSLPNKTVRERIESFLSECCDGP